MSLKKAFRIPLLIGVTLASSSLTHAASISIVNGSFELDAIQGVYATLGVNSIPNETRVLQGWTVTGSIDLIHDYWKAADGQQSLDMNGFFAAGAISQSIYIPAAGSVTINFSMAGNPDNTPNVKTLGVTLGTLQTFTFDIKNPFPINDRQQMGWVTKTAIFNVPAPGNYPLTFASMDDPNGAYGPALDNITASYVANVPDGGSTCALLGLAMLGFGAIRRSSKSA